jgi:phosphoribosylaminoimidazole synthetase
MRAAVRSTYNPQVLSDIGAFGGLFDASSLTALRQPVLVASTDGVGTKVELGARMGRCQGLGVDLVNHCINDILVQGARPLFFLDYIASSHLEVEAATALVEGISMACREANCALIGGETAEMPGVYQPGCFDLAGTIVGCVERGEILPKKTIAPGDVLIGLASSEDLCRYGARHRLPGLRPPLDRPAAGAPPVVLARTGSCAVQQPANPYSGTGPYYGRRLHR